MHARVLVAVLASFMILPSAGAAQKGKKSDEKEAKTEEKSPYKPFDELVEGAVKREGFFDTYQKADHLYLAVPPDRLGQEFLVSNQISRGIGSRDLFGGTMLDYFWAHVLAFERQGERVFLVKRPWRFTAPQGTPVEKAVRLAYGSSVVATAKIESVRPDSALVIDVYPILVSDLSNVGERIKEEIGQANLDRERSTLNWVKAFPKNVNVDVTLTFTPSDPPGLTTVPDDRYIPIGIHYAIAELPEDPMTPRLADDRVGYFLTVHQDFSKDDKTFFVRYVNRWRLEKEDPEARVSDPVEPIVYYLDHTIPQEYRSSIKAGVEAWQRAFEAAGLSNAIVARDLPADSLVDPEDFRYHTIRWSVSSEPGYGAIGPSVVDPRTGEILDADILMEGAMVLGFKSAYRQYVSPGEAVREMFEVSEGELTRLASGGESALLGAELGAQGTLLRAVLAGTGVIGPGDPVPMDFVGEGLKWVTMHEVGHTLGLRHNFRASTDTPFEHLQDREWAEERGIYNSVMEYPSINVASDPDQQGYYYNPTVGSEDIWRIRYGYTPDPEEAKVIASEVAKPGHAYGTDEDVRGPGALDPTISIFDLSGDPLQWGQDRAALITSIWSKLDEKILAPGDPYYELSDNLVSLLIQYGRALATGVKYIGGSYLYRDHKGDPDGRPPFVPISAAKQWEALAFLTKWGFGEKAFAVPQEILAKLGADRWNHWGNRTTYNGRIDFPFHEMVLGIQTAFLDQLVSPYRLEWIRDAELRNGPASGLKIWELLDELTEAIFDEVYTAPGRNVYSLRRDLQRAWLDRLVHLVATPSPRTPADARAVARTTLMDLDRRLAARLREGGLGPYTTAHLTEARARITKALEAGMEVELLRQLGKNQGER